MMHDKTWTVAEAKSRLSEILRLASSEGPQRIGARKSYVLVPETLWRQYCPPGKPLGRWLVEDLPRGGPIPIPDRAEPQRTMPFEDDEN